MDVFFQTEHLKPSNLEKSGIHGRDITEKHWTIVTTLSLQHLQQVKAALHFFAGLCRVVSGKGHASVSKRHAFDRRQLGKFCHVARFFYPTAYRPCIVRSHRVPPAPPSRSVRASVTTSSVQQLAYQQRKPPPVRVRRQTQPATNVQR